MPYLHQHLAPELGDLPEQLDRCVPGYTSAQM
jgi:hypothetical protein